MKTLRLVLITTIFLSCRHPTVNPDVRLANNNDTLEIIKRYPSTAIREIITYTDNKPYKNIGYTETGDSITQPRLIYTSSSKLFVFIPLNQFKTTDLYFGFDSAKAVNGQSPKFIVKDIKSSSIITIKQDMVDEQNKLTGAIKCWDSVNRTFHYYPFDIQTK